MLVLLRNSRKEEKSQRVAHSCVLFEPVEKVLCVADGELETSTSGYLVRTTAQMSRLEGHNPRMTQDAHSGF